MRPPHARSSWNDGRTASHLPFLEPKVLLAQTWVTAAEGIVSTALAIARQAAEVAASQHQPAVEVFALHTAVCFGDRTVADRLTQLATQVDGPRASAAAAHATALAADDGAALHAASVRLEQMGALLLAADIATPLPLTDREREIVTLAASGLSNRQIAQRLVVSVRTVEGHLYHATTKLGASGRTELTTLLHGD